MSSFWEGEIACWFLYLKILISTYLYPYTQVDLSLILVGKISPLAECPPEHIALGHNIPQDILP